MLPIEEVLPALKAALAQGPNAVLVAPPGAGKTTGVPPALLDAPWLGGGRIIVLEPRRLAARAAAARMAAMLGEPVGATVGFRVRLQSKVSARTRIEVVTEGVFTRRILADPGLDGVAAVLFDEFHERSLEADLGLALARDAQGLLRPDLRLLAMSATLDGAAVARLLGEAPVIESQGRAFPVETRYLGRDPALRLEDQMVRAIERALAEETGGVLAFLPGQGEILRVAERLAERLRDRPVDIDPLYGALDLAAQDRAIAPAPPGRRKVVLATSIAETSLTLQGVRVVVDCGLARTPRYDVAAGVTRLATVRVSRAAADQRRGRAGRTEPGVCYRLWDEAETRSLPPFAEPEIRQADLTGFALDLARWGARDAAGLAFLDPPPKAAFAEARDLLTRLGALDHAGALTPHGEALARLPLAPRLAHMLLKAAERGQAERAARIAALVGDRGLGGNDVDLRHRLDRFSRDGGPAARAGRDLAARWAKDAGKGASGNEGDLSDGGLLSLAFPERVAKARGAPGEFLMANGRGAFLDATDALARERWLAVGELGGGERRDRILLAAPLEEAEVLVLFAEQLSEEDRVETAGGRTRAKRLTRLGRIVVGERLLDDQAAVASALAGEARAKGLASLPFGEATRQLRYRASLAGLDALTDERLTAQIDLWLTPLLVGRQALADLGAGELDAAIRGLIDWNDLKRLDAEAPTHWTTPAGSRLPIDYAAEGGPRVEVRPQELFGLDAHPSIARGALPLTLALTSPAHRPMQVTRDLPGFWRGSWKEVRAEMRGRYPKHPWPEDPLAAPPTTRAKPRG